MAIFIVLLARVISVGIPVTLLRNFREFNPTYSENYDLEWVKRRHISSLGADIEIAERDIILTLTYTIVVFSILVQGLSIGNLIQLSLANKN